MMGISRSPSASPFASSGLAILMGSQACAPAVPMRCHLGSERLCCLQMVYRNGVARTRPWQQQ